jgi:hypothetical protein
MYVYKIFIDKMFVDKMNIDKMLVDKMSLDKSRQKVCMYKLNICRKMSVDKIS